MADSDIGVCLGFLLILHLRLAFHNLFAGVQGQISEFFSEQTVRIDNMLLVPNFGDLYEQQPKPVDHNRSSGCAGNPSLQDITSSALSARDQPIEPH